MSSELLSDVHYLARVAPSGESLRSKGRMVHITFVDKPVGDR